MRVVRELFEIDSHAYSLDAGLERAQGCHLTDVIKYMQQAKYADREQAHVQAGWAGGFLLERALAQHAIDAELEQNRAGLVKIGQVIWCLQCRTVFISPKHFKERGHVGIAATPDAVLVKEWMLEEWKLTKFSLGKGGADAEMVQGAEVRERADYDHIALEFWHWIVQIKGYCYLLGLLYDIPMLRARITVLYVNGDYGKSTRDYVTCRYWFQFNERELEEQWDAIVNHALDAQLLEVH
jgi:hypothetical protein